jgi:SagB-type dehydrogenase family enzyme
VRFRRARTLVMTYYPGQIGVHNFLTKTRFGCSLEALDFLSKLDDWHTEEQIVEYFPKYDRVGLAAQVAELAANHAIVVEGTAQATLDQKFRDSWPWGMVGGYYHFTTRNTTFAPDADQLDMVNRRRASGEAPPDWYESNRSRERVVALPAADADSGALSLMRRRRSERSFSHAAIDLRALADCLYAGNGIVGFRDTPEYGRLPISMTPSLGGSNPYELYVYAAKVQDLERGFYHYAGLEHDLAYVHAGPRDVSEMFGGQAWISAAPAIIFLVAHFRRTAWRHHLAMAYRSVLMEAGHIAQNIALAASSVGLSAVSIGSLKQSMIESFLLTPEIEASVILGVALGQPAVEQQDSSAAEDAS